MRALAITLFVGACSSSTSLQACDVDSLAAGDVVTTSYISCGTFNSGDVNYTDEAMAAAQACVLNAMTNNRPFELIYDAADSSNHVTGDLRVAWDGVLPMGAKTLVARVYAGEGHEGDMAMRNVSATQCMSITATAGCTPAMGIPCLTCTPMGSGNVVCRH